MSGEINLAKAIDKFSERSFGQAPRYIVDSDHPLPAGQIVNQLYALSNCSGFTCTDHQLLSNGGSYPTNLLWGWEVYGNYSDVTVEEGYLLCIYNT